MSKQHGKHARVKGGKDDRFMFASREDDNSTSNTEPSVSSSADTELLPPVSSESDSGADATQLLPIVTDGQEDHSSDATVMIPSEQVKEGSNSVGAAGSHTSASTDQSVQDDGVTVMLTPVKDGESRDGADDATSDASDVDAGIEVERSQDADASPTKSKSAQDSSAGAEEELAAEKGAHVGSSHGSNAFDGSAGIQFDQEGGYPDRNGGAQTFAPAVLDEQSAYVAAFGEVPLKRRRGGLKVLGITVGIIVAAALVVYVVGAFVFMGRFLPSTVVGGEDISLKTDEQVVDMLDGIAKDYRLSLFGGGFSYRLTGEDVGLSVDTESVVKAMHKDLDAWKWPLLLLESSHDETNQLSVSFNREQYEPALKAELDKYNETARDPVNATIVFDEATQKFIVKPEQVGTKLNVEAVLASTAEAIDKLDSTVSIGDDHLVKPTVYSTDEKLKQAAELASGMVKANLTLVMGGQPVGEVKGSQLSEFVSVNENFEVTFREEDMDEWVNELARSFDTVGTERIYTRPDGKQIAVSGGVYGWEVDSAELKNAILEGVRAGTVGEVVVPCLEEAAKYQGPNMPDWGTRYIDVDLSEQYVRFYEGDEIIWEAPCITGQPDGTHNTGPGVWRVNGKESPSKLIGYENGKKIYETSVTYWMPFEGNGIGFHDATWQPSFGGSMYANGYGSHGCVNLSYGDAESLYGIIEYGDVVIVHG